MKKEPVSDGRNMKYSARQKPVLLCLLYFPTDFNQPHGHACNRPVAQRYSNLSDLLIFLHRLTCKSDTKFLKDILIHI